MQKPLVGQTVKVNKITDYTKGGATFLKGAKAITKKIEHVYIGSENKVRLTNGDVWRVKPNPSSDSHFVIDEVLEKPQ